VWNTTVLTFYATMNIGHKNLSLSSSSSCCDGRFCVSYWPRFFTNADFFANI